MYSSNIFIFCSYYWEPFENQMMGYFRIKKKNATICKLYTLEFAFAFIIGIKAHHKCLSLF